MTINSKRTPGRVLLAAIVVAAAGLAGAQMSGPMMTTNYFPLLDGARYDYVFTRGPHTSATAVMHAGQQWAGMMGLTVVHLTFTCTATDIPCDPDRMDFYGMGPDGMHYYGGSGAMPDRSHYMVTLTSPEWTLKNPVAPGTMMGHGMGYQNAETWQAGVAGMNTMMGPQGYMSMYQAQALETVITPAGTFTGALHVHERHGNGYERDVWYAANVGIVRWADDQEEAVLSRFTKASGPVPKTAMAVEYYDAALDHYFVTADPAEMAALDTGRLAGWQRTGMGFNVFDPAEPAPMTAPVCRFYGNPAYGLDTHFYSASMAECAAIARDWPAQWTFESSNVFRMALPDMMSGACPAGTMAVYRTWNRRADSNHRYTTDPAVQAMMMSHGNVAEGYGNPPAAMCSPL